jgi:adenosylhomocysteinase
MFSTGHPSFVMSCLFTNQSSAGALEQRGDGEVDEAGLSAAKALDEKVAVLHLGKLGAKLTKLTSKQADYLGIQRKAL